MAKILHVCGGLLAAALVYFLLQPIFAGQVILSPTFKVGDFAVHYYGIVLGLAVLSGYWVIRKNAWRFGLSNDEADKITFWAIVAALCSARFYFVLFELNYFTANPSEILQFWNGGLSIYGALFGGAGFLAFYARKKIYSVKQVFDLAALALPLGQMIGRFGNLFNYEAYGAPTDLPWKMFVPESHRTENQIEYYHPAFLYEAIGSLSIFIILISLRGKVRPGNLAILYIAYYSALRFALEFIRTDSVYVSGWRVDQVVSVFVFIIAIWLFFNNNRSLK